MSENLPSTLPYAGPPDPGPLRQYRAIGLLTLILGVAGVFLNALIAATLAHQLFKQWRRIKGASSRPIEPWLLITSAEAALSVALAIFAIVIGTMTLRLPARAPNLHRIYAWLKLPLAFIFALCVGWGASYVITKPMDIVANAGIALILSAIYPYFLLRTFPASPHVLDGVR